MHLVGSTNQLEHLNVPMECQSSPVQDHMVTAMLKQEKRVPVLKINMLFLAGKKMFGERSNVVIRAIGEQGL
ncbi:hypothetical protein SynTAK9802_00685 [Synechococcus sp. TAK9802]|nr:hypothetical protein SynTAK9802_00685 [Synechococcus sp. TAK9802]